MKTLSRGWMLAGAALLAIAGTLLTATPSQAAGYRGGYGYGYGYGFRGYVGVYPGYYGYPVRYGYPYYYGYPYAYPAPVVVAPPVVVVR